MCYGFKMFGVLAIIPATVLLGLSFFVLLATRKLDSNPLKVFGKVIAVLLWICTAIIILANLRGGHLEGKMHKMMKGDMGRPMMQGQMPPQRMAE